MTSLPPPLTISTHSSPSVSTSRNSISDEWLSRKERGGGRRRRRKDGKGGGSMRREMCVYVFLCEREREREIKEGEGSTWKERG